MTAIDMQRIIFGPNWLMFILKVLVASENPFSKRMAFDLIWSMKESIFKLLTAFADRKIIFLFSIKNINKSLCKRKSESKSCNGTCDFYVSVLSQAKIAENTRSKKIMKFLEIIQKRQIVDNLYIRFWIETLSVITSLRALVRSTFKYVVISKHFYNMNMPAAHVYGVTVSVAGYAKHTKNTTKTLKKITNLMFDCERDEKNTSLANTFNSLNEWWI